MIYTFKCEACGEAELVSRSMKQGPPKELDCQCGNGVMHRDWQADSPMIDTSKCRDASEIKPQFRTRSHWDGGKSAGQVEAEFNRSIENKRKQIRDAGGQRGAIRQSHSVPAHLYHGKIRETGDRQYWDDPRNLARHKECKVDD